MLTVVRIEHPRFRHPSGFPSGPYKFFHEMTPEALFLIHVAREYQHETMERPQPWADGLPSDCVYGSGYAPSDWVFGFQDIPQMWEWFPERSLEIFEGLGFSLGHYSVPEPFVRIGGHQVMFVYAEATFRKYEPLCLPDPIVRREFVSA